MRSVHKFLHLSMAEKWILLQAALLLPLNVFALRVAGLKSWQSALSRFTLLHTPQDSTRRVWLQAQLTAKLVAAVSRRRAYRVSCLPESLTLWYLLRRQGIAGALCIGVRKAATRLEAHAWVEYSGSILNDCNDVRERFVPFDRSIMPARVSAS